MFQTNLFGPFWCVKFAKDYMPRDGSASIILHSSMGSHIIWPGNGFYCISKLGINGLTKLLYQELTPKCNIRVNCVASGPIKTKFLTSLVKTMSKEQHSKSGANGKTFYGFDLSKIASSNWDIIKYVYCLISGYVQYIEYINFWFDLIFCCGLIFCLYVFLFFLLVFFDFGIVTHRRGSLLKRIGSPEEAANVFAFLASDEASYVSGEIIVLGGSIQARL